MDKARAIKILELPPSPTAKEAKLAFRRLVKSCHPDLYARDPERAKRAEAQMKEINQAFSFLFPRLPDRVAVKKTPGKRAESFKPGIFDRLKKGFRPGRFARKASGNDPERAKGRGRRPPLRVRRPGRPISFETVLKESRGNKPGAGCRTGMRAGSADAYERYVRLRRQMQRSQAREGLERVEKISPVPPVSPIKGS